MEIISKSERIECERWAHQFSWREDPNAGFGFDCDKDGNLINMNPLAQENYQKCISGEYDVIDHGIQHHTWTYRQPAVGKCCCGREVVLDHFTNTCECGRDYNSAGSLLAPREQWGEETGEHWTDIIRIP